MDVLGEIFHPHLADEVLDVGTLLQQSLGKVLLLTGVPGQLRGYVLHASRRVTPGRPAQRRLYVQGSRAFRETSIARNKAGQDLPNRLTGLVREEDKIVVSGRALLHVFGFN